MTGRIHGIAVHHEDLSAEVLARVGTGSGRPDMKLGAWLGEEKHACGGA